MSSQERRRARALRLCFAALLIGAIGLKLALLFTSQSLADGDEAVTGLMAMHILADGSHPIYPYGVQYGVGGGVDAHLAAVLFAVFGASDVALKGAGLLVWLLTLALVSKAALHMGGACAGAAAALLYAFAPQASEWSLKVAGGHGPGVLLSVGAVAMIECRAPRLLVAGLLPLAAITHPTVIPFCLALAAYLVWKGNGPGERAAILLSLASSALAVWVAFRPPPSGVWNPTATRLDAAGLLAALPATLAGLFAANLNARVLPPLFQLFVSVGWLVALATVAALAGGPARRWLYLLAPLGVVAAVRSTELASRHLLVVYPLACIVLGAGLAKLPGRYALLTLLVVSGAAVQVQTMFDPAIHGPDPQDRGLLRDNVRDVLRQLDASRTSYVYCLDPMFQWNLVWGSRERIIARWTDPVDRVPEYPARVDAAQRAGFPVALVARRTPDALTFEVFPVPAEADLRVVFPPAPALPSDP